MPRLKYKDPITGEWTSLNLNGSNGSDGKSAYEYAKEAGYTGTETEFAAKLAVEFPQALPNPYALTINGTTYDGSSAVDITSVINTLIDTKLGVVENGSY